jgi:hypothetical protein
MVVSSPSAPFCFVLNPHDAQIAIVEHSDVRRLVFVEGDKGLIQRSRMLGIDGVPRLGARMNDRQHAITALDANKPA